MFRHLLAVMSLAIGVAHADELVLSNGEHWQVSGTVLHRGQPAPPLDVTMNLHSVGIDCKAGLEASANTAKPAYLPSSFYPSVFEQPDEGDGDAYATVCADLPRAVLVANLQWKGKLAAGDANSFRSLLEYLMPELAANPRMPTPALSLFDPPIANVALDAKTGVWSFVRDRTNASVTILVPLWPAASVVLQLQRSEGAQQCSTVGFGTTTARPTWAPDTFYAYGAHRDGAGFACFDGADGRLVMFSLTETHLRPNDVQRVAALLVAIAHGLVNMPVLLPQAPTPTTP